MLSVEIKENDKIVGELAAAEKLFKTGSKGYFRMGKIQIGEKRYQVQVQLVEIGSKPRLRRISLSYPASPMTKNSFVFDAQPRASLTACHTPPNEFSG